MHLFNRLFIELSLSVLTKDLLKCVSEHNFQNWYYFRFLAYHFNMMNVLTNLTFHLKMNKQYE